MGQERLPVSQGQTGKSVSLTEKEAAVQLETEMERLRQQLQRLEKSLQALERLEYEEGIGEEAEGGKFYGSN